MAVMAPVIEADRLFRFFHAGEEETLALRGVTLAVEPGELVAVDRTVRVRQVDPAGLPRRSRRARRRHGEGDRAGDEPPPEPERAALRARAIGMLFQSANLFEHLTLDRNLALSQSLAGRPDHGRRRRVARGAGPRRTSPGLPVRAVRR